MISQEEIKAVLDEYNLNEVTIGVLGSHSALDICRGAKDLGFRTLVVCAAALWHQGHTPSRGARCR
jgi:5-formaminoimidazole-4-carboxamide-1-(beta)-D-ribofuranosyl 5'-monophosphate synthetase